MATPGAGKTTYALRLATELLGRGTISRGHRRGPDRAPQDPVGRGGRPGRHPHRPEVLQLLGPALQRVRRRRADLRPGRQPARSCTAPAPRRRRPWSSSTRSTTAATRCRGVTRSARRSSPPPGGWRSPARRSAPTPRPIPFVTLREDARRHPPLVRRLHLRLRRGAARRGRAPGALPRLRRRDALAHQGRRRGRRPARRAADQGPRSPRPGAPRSTPRASGSRRSSRPPTGGSPRCAAASRTPVASSSPPTRPRPARTPRSSRRSPARSSHGRAVRRRRARRERIEEFAASDSRWMVAVRMVSEGVDVPRLCVGVYATSTSTPLFFAQAVGRFVRARRRGETASVFLPSVPVILEHAARLEERARPRPRPQPTTDDDRPRMWAEEDALLDAANRTDDATAGPGRRWPSRRWSPTRSSTTCSSTRSSSACTRPSGPRRSRSTSACPACSSPTRCRRCSTSGRAAQVRTAAARARDAPMPVAGPPGPRRAAQGAQQARRRLRPQERRRRTRTSTSTCGAPAAARRSRRDLAEQVTERIDKIRRWFVGRR